MRRGSVIGPLILIGIGGLFLAFPAIFPASATLIEKHERQRKQEKGLHGEERGTDTAAIDAVGAAMGSIGLIAFAGICWWLIPRYPAPLVLGGATVAWLLVSFSAWNIRQRCRWLFNRYRDTSGPAGLGRNLQADKGDS